MYIDLLRWEKMGCPKVSVKLNGTEMCHCVEADDKAGWVKIQRADWWEKYMAAIPTQELKGNVEIWIEEQQNES